MSCSSICCGQVLFDGRAGSLSQHVLRRSSFTLKAGTKLTAPEDYDLPLDKVEYQIRPAKRPWQVYIIWPKTGHTSSCRDGLPSTPTPNKLPLFRRLIGASRGMPAILAQ